MLGFLSPSSRGFLGTVMVILYTLFGFVGGYVSSRVYKFFGGERWKLNFALTPVALPGTVFAIFFLLNLFVWARGASGAVPFTTMLLVVLMWFVISVPLSITGSWLGFKAQQAEPPTRTNQIPRQIPKSGGYMRPIPSMLLAGVLPFGAIFVELYFIMKSIWFSKVYYMFGFLFICYGLMIITSAAITILMIYFLLCAENYHWQWRAFGTAGASSVYVFAYAMVYWVKDLSFSSWTGGVLYLGYSLLISFMFFILTGKLVIHISPLLNSRLTCLFRYYRFRCCLGVRAEDLWLDQGGLDVFFVAECSLGCVQIRHFHSPLYHRGCRFRCQTSMRCAVLVIDPQINTPLATSTYVIPNRAIWNAKVVTCPCLVSA